MRSIIVLLVLSTVVISTTSDAKSIEQLWQQIATAEEGAAQARLSARQAQASQAQRAWLPNITIEGRSTWLAEPLTNTTDVPPLAPGMQPMTLEQTLRPDQFNKVSVQANWLVFAGGQVRYQNIAAGHAQTAQAAQLKAVRLAQLPTLVERYRKVQLAHQQVYIRQQAQARLQAHVHRAEQLQAQGQLAQIDVLSVQTELAQAKQALTQANSDLTLAELALATHANERVNATGQLPRPKSIRFDMGAAVQFNPNLQALAAAQSASSAQAKVSRGKLLPSVYTFAQHELLPDELAASEPQTAVGIGFTWQLVDRSGRFQQLKQAQAKEQEAKYNLQAAQRDIRLAIARQQHLFNGALEQVDAIAQKLNLAEQQRRLASQSFNAGLATVQDVTDAELAYAAIALEQQNAVLQAHLSLAQLAVLSGDESLYFSAL